MTALHHQDKDNYAPQQSYKITNAYKSDKENYGWKLGTNFLVHNWYKLIEYIRAGFSTRDSKLVLKLPGPHRRAKVVKPVVDGGLLHFH